MGQVRRGLADSPLDLLLSRAHGDALALPMPLFFDWSLWHRWHPATAQALVESITRRGIAVSALHSELGLYDTDESGDLTDRLPPEAMALRILPYRNERYGLSDQDLTHACVVDLHLVGSRDESGRFAYSAARLGRWEQTPDDKPLSGGGWVPAMNLPPDVPDASGLQSKLEQLRRLAPQAAVMISIGPEWLENELDWVLDAQPDALLVRMHDVRADGLTLASMLRGVSARMAKNNVNVPIWLTPPHGPADEHFTVDDAVKLVALGASAIAIDDWLDDHLSSIDAVAPPSSFADDPMAEPRRKVEAIVAEALDERLERFRGLYATLAGETQSELLGSFDPDVAARLGIRVLQV